MARLLLARLAGALSPCALMARVLLARLAGALSPCALTGSSGTHRYTGDP